MSGDGVVCRRYYIRTLCSSSEIESALGHTMVRVINKRAPARRSAYIITAVAVYMCYDDGSTIRIYIYDLIVFNNHRYIELYTPFVVRPYRVFRRPHVTEGCACTSSFESLPATRPLPHTCNSGEYCVVLIII